MTLQLKTTFSRFLKKKKELVIIHSARRTFCSVNGHIGYFVVDEDGTKEEKKTFDQYFHRKV
jgi:hypothetical protein